MPQTLREAIDRTTAATPRARGSFKWTAPGPDGFGAAVAEMDFGAAPAILDALDALSADANFGYLFPGVADQLGRAAVSYRDAGADLVFIDALESQEEIVAVGEALPDTPKVINWVEGGKTPLIDPARLLELEFRVVFCSLSALLAATSAIQERLARLRDLGATQPVPAVAFDDFNELIGMADVTELERRFTA